MYQPLLYSKRFKHHFIINIKVSPILTEWTNVTLSTCCRARLLLLSAQVSKFHFQSLNSETKGAELMLKSQCTTHHHHPPPTTFKTWSNDCFHSHPAQKPNEIYDFPKDFRNGFSNDLLNFFS